MRIVESSSNRRTMARLLLQYLDSCDGAQPNGPRQDEAQGPRLVCRTCD